MLKKILKWILLVFGCLLVIVLILYAIVYFKTESRINKTYSVNLQTLVLPSDSFAYISGRHTAENRGCLGCHGGDLSGGRAFLDDKSPLGSLYSSNITSGKGGINYNDADWIRALRHGLGKDNKSLWFMPSHEIYHLSNQEMASLLYFLKQQPPVDNSVPGKSLKPLGRILTFLDKFPLFPAEMIDHSAKPAETVAASVTADYGAYLATSCKGCHGPDMKGTPAHTKEEPPSPDISSSGNTGKWKDVEFITAIRTGITPEGKKLTDFMPWKEFTYSDDELKAIFLYLQQIK